jgi:hypothetical protein
MLNTLSEFNSASARDDNDGDISDTMMTCEPGVIAYLKTVIGFASLYLLAISMVWINMLVEWFTDYDFVYEHIIYALFAYFLTVMGQT